MSLFRNLRQFAPVSFEINRNVSVDRTLGCHPRDFVASLLEQSFFVFCIFSWNFWNPQFFIRESVSELLFTTNAHFYGRCQSCLKHNIACADITKTLSLYLFSTNQKLPSVPSWNFQHPINCFFFFRTMQEGCGPVRKWAWRWREELKVDPPTVLNLVAIETYIDHSPSKMLWFCSTEIYRVQN